MKTQQLSGQGEMLCYPIEAKTLIGECITLVPNHRRMRLEKRLPKKRGYAYLCCRLARLTVYL